MKKFLGIFMASILAQSSASANRQVVCQPLQIDREKITKQMVNDLKNAHHSSLSNDNSKYGIREQQMSNALYLEIVKSLTYSDACHPNAKVMTIEQIISHPIATDPLVKAQQFKRDFWLAYNSAIYDSSFLKPSSSQEVDKMKNFFAKYGEDGIKLYENIDINPLMNNDIAKEVAFMQKVVDYYIQPNDDFKKTEQLLRNAGFDVTTDTAHYPSNPPQVGVYSGNAMIGKVKGIGYNISQNYIDIKVIPTDESYKKVKNTKVRFYSHGIQDL